MSNNDRPLVLPTPVTVNKGHQPAVDNRGHQPLAMDGHQPRPVAVAFPQNLQGGHQPTTSQAAPANPPNQGSSGKK
jgi:hypothetical protein